MSAKRTTQQERHPTGDLFGHRDGAEVAARPSNGSVIESLKPTARNPERVMIRADGKVRATLPRMVVQDLGIDRGTPWTTELAERLAAAVTFDKARRSALRTLERRALSTGEMIDRLRRKGFDPQTAREVTGQLAESGYLDDVEYARAVLRELTRVKPAGAALMRRRLFQKRISREIADAVIAEFADQRNDAVSGGSAEGLEASDDKLTQFVEKKLRTMSSLDDATKARRLYGALARRGFDPGTCRQYVERFVRHNDAID